jgi:outer membrane protein assembly factor BamB
VFRAALICCVRGIGVVTIAAFGAAGCGSHTSALPISQTPLADEGRLANHAYEYWPTFAYDYKRTGYNPTVHRLDKQTVSKLQLRWKQSVGDEVFASPVTYAGNLIIVTYGSTNQEATVYDLSTSDGRILWRFAMPGLGQMTPSIDPEAGLVIVGNAHKDAQTHDLSYVFALRLLDGTLIWRQQLHGMMRSAPVIAGGMVYVGRAGGDEPLCNQGGITALNESTGDIVWNWNVDADANEGGAVWGALAYDGANLIFGTGNTCQEPVPTSNGAVALDLDGNLVWSIVAVKNSEYDADTGSGVMLFDGTAQFINKNGRYYALNEETGKIEWTSDLNTQAGPPTWLGGFTTPTTDGTTIVEGTGLYEDSASQQGRDLCIVDPAKPAEVFPGYYSKLEGMNLSGKVVWSVSMQNRLVGYVALAGELGFVGLDQNFVALNLNSGKTLWAFPTQANIDASMIVVPGGVYGADDDGNVYAFSLPAK